MDIFPVGNGLSRILSVGMKESKDFAVLIQEKIVGIKLNENGHMLLTGSPRR